MSWQINLANNSNFTNTEESMVVYQQYAINLAESLGSGTSSLPQQNSELVGDFFTPRRTGQFSDIVL